MRYNKDQKEKALRLMAPPENRRIPEISDEMGIPQPTLYLWRKKAQEEGRVAPGDGRDAEAWGSEEKFRIVVDTIGLADAELSEYCRKKGVYPEQIESWRDACMRANSSRVEQIRAQKQHDKELHGQIKTLKKEVRRKDKALAETAALLVLRKKAAAIWGEEEDA
jgi:transposase-like protein